ncbi:MAG: hypothetical protein OEW00_01345 [candidate division Zixibacteria bacterium]|nr:hypothetical protein [candidate division Zixibacteria bacterium]
MLERIISTLALLAATTVAGADGIIVSQSIDKGDVPFEGKINFEIKLEWSGSQSAYRFSRPLAPTFDRLRTERFSSSVSSTGSAADEVTTKVFKYTLVPVSAGIGRIDPVTIDYVTWPDSVPGQLITEALAVNIASPVKAEVSEGIGPVVWIAAGVVLVIVVAGLIRLRARRPVEIVQTPAEVLLERLTDLKRQAASDLKEFQSGFSRLLTDYLASQYNVRLVEYTEDEIAIALTATDLTIQQKEQITAWLVKAHADKFMPVASSPGDTIRLESEIRQFFERI